MTDAKSEIKNGRVLSELGSLKHVFIDKTGTMTTSEFEVVIVNSIIQL